MKHPLRSTCAVLTILSTLASRSHALVFPTSRLRRASTGTGFNIQGAGVPSMHSLATSPQSTSVGDLHDLLYEANVTFAGGTVVPVQLDTGSVDMWVAPLAGFAPGTLQMPNVNPVNIVYGSGSVSGPIATAGVEFGAYSVPNQAFLVATSVDQLDLSSQGVYGILGLSFASASQIEYSYSASQMDPTLGQPFLANVFAQNPSAPNYIAFQLGRAGDLGETAQGTFSISEVDPQYASVLEAPKVPLFQAAVPPSIMRWNIAVDSVTINGVVSSFVSGVSGATPGKAIALLDTGTSFTLVPQSLVDVIYSSFPTAQYLASQGLWVMSCTDSSSVAFTIAGQSFTVHPLDLTVVSSATLDDGSTATVCVNAIQPFTLSFGANEFDFIFGDTFLRNVFSLYNWGNATTPPYTQLLSITNPATAQQDFAATRAQALAQLPPQVDLGALNVAAGAANAEADPSSTSSPSQKLANYTPLLLALVGTNIALGLTLSVVAFLFFRKMRNEDGLRRSAALNRASQATVVDRPQRYERVKTTDPDPRNRDSGIFVSGP